MSTNFPAQPQPTPVRTAEQRPGGLKLGDVYYTLFRHKWKILVLTLLGVLAAAGIWFFKGPLYQSQAKLLVRYVRDARAVDVSLGAQGDVKSPDSRGENIINSEIEILTSRDLALEVADLVGPDKILAKAGGGTNRFAAAGLILRGLEVDVPRRSSVIRVAFNHPDPDMAQTILRALVQNYLRKHAEVHRAVGVFDEFLTRQTDALRSQLRQTEQELQKLKLTANVTSVEESKRILAEQASRVRQELMGAEAELAERRTILEKAQQAAGIAAPTNTTVAATETPLDPVQEQHYRTVLARLETLRIRELELLLQFTPESQDVRQVRDLIASAEKTKRELETAEPRLLRLAQLVLRANPGANAAGSRTTLGAGMDLGALEAEAAALEARVKKLREYQDEVRAEVAKINEVEQAISELQRNKQREETKYLYYSASLEQARIDESLGASSLANINVLQEASTPAINAEKTRKIVLGVLFAGLAAGVGLAFLLEMVLDARLKRPSDVEQKLNLPLFLSIPDFTRNGHAKALRQSRVAELPAGDSTTASAGDSADLPAPGRAADPLRTFHEALRDRLIMYFELKDMHHKPKLVGVTGTHHGAGVSSIAAGLAETLSETGDGNVLLVDMNPEHGPSVYPFYRGKPGCGLNEALEVTQRESAQVQDNLYVVSLNGRNQGNRVGVVPRRFASLLPKMKASDYDYIIFDMPPVSQTSVTAKVSGLLDMTFLVVESERSNVEQTKRCATLLAESRANVTAVLNRHHNYLPEKLRTDV
jgi:uncharacterized protein involved in exopolysaccharide biosynthesis/Mrp family chromosome partitioning ATPase